MMATMSIHPLITAYFVVCYLILASCIFRKMIGVRLGWWGGISLLTPWSHLGFEQIVPTAGKQIASMIPTLPVILQNALVKSSNNSVTTVAEAKAGARVMVGILVLIISLLLYGIYTLFFPNFQSTDDVTLEWRGLLQFFLNYSFLDSFNKGMRYLSAYLMMWMAAYGVVLLIRFSLLIIFQVISYCSRGFIYTVITIARYTIWNKYIRRQFRSFMKSVRKVKMLSEWLEILAIQSFQFPFIISMSSTLAVCVIRYKRLYGPELNLGIWMYTTAAAHVTSYFICCILLLRCLFISTSPTYSEFTAKKYKGSDIYTMQLCLLYIPCLASAFPGLFYPTELLFAPATEIKATLQLSKMFWWSSVWTCISLWAIAAHLWTIQWGSCRASTWPWLESEYGVRSNTYLIYNQEMNKRFYTPFSKWCDYILPVIGLQWLNNIINGGEEIISNDTDMKTGNSSCMHEDGGPNAVFEQCDINKSNIPKSPSSNGNGISNVTNDGNNVNRSNKSQVLVGSTYRVVSCACWKVKALKANPAEWCEWCRCRHCGVKVMPKGLFRPDYQEPIVQMTTKGIIDSEHASSDPEQNELDATLDLFLIFILVIFAFVTALSHESIYYHITLAGYSAVIHLTHHLLRLNLYVKS